MEQLTFQIREFDGPLDLLLSLITTHKMDIYDIPIALILDQYLEQIRKMREMNMEVTSEFLAMAARLIYIKTAELLPKNEVAQDMKRQITEELLEYRLVQTAADLLRADWLGERLFVRQPAELPNLPYDRITPITDVTGAYVFVEGRIKQKAEGRENMNRFSEELTQKPVSVASRVTLLIERLTRMGERAYRDLFEPSDTPSGRVATFLAMLELMKARRLILRQDEDGRQFLRLAEPDEIGDPPILEDMDYE